MPVAKPNLGLLPWVIVQCSLPHSRPRNTDGTEATFYKRTNGQARLVMLADPEVGLPYGKLPRLVLAHLVAQYKQNRAHLPPNEARVVDLGPSCRALMRRIGLDGEGRGHALFKNQVWRLLTTDIQSRGADETGRQPWRWIKRHAIADDARLWWRPHDASTVNVRTMHPSYVELSPRFARACENAIPVDVDTMAAMRSPFAIDLYAWLSYRCGTLHAQGSPSADISWDRLMEQFGHGYNRPVDFRRAFRQHLGTVLEHYPAPVDHESWPNGITVYARAPHIAKRRESARRSPTSFGGTSSAFSGPR